MFFITLNDMDLKATLDIIIKDLEETRDIIDDLKAYPGVPLLQIELAKSKCRSVGEMIALLKDIPEFWSKIVQPGTGDKGQVREPNAELKKPEPVKLPGPPKTVIPMEKVHGEENKPVITDPETSILADQFTDTPESFHEKLGGIKHDEDITGNILKSKPFPSLSEAIGISDKFLFIRELFNGSLEAYNGAIEKLDSSSGLTEAKEIIAGFTSVPEENEAMTQLLDLLKRKFPSDE